MQGQGSGLSLLSPALCPADQWPQVTATRHPEVEALQKQQPALDFPQGQPLNFQVPIQKANAGPLVQKAEKKCC